MKIKVDFVTNSSSEVFGTVMGDSAVVGGLLGLLALLLKGCGLGGGDGGDQQSDGIDKQVDIYDAENMANQIAKAALEDAKKQDEITKNAYNQAAKTVDSAKFALQKELDECQKQWDDSEKTIDKKDPSYADFKKQYDDYQEYLKSQIEQAEYQKKMIELEKAKLLEENDSKSEWVKQRQADMIAVKEETAMLQAVAKGYNVPGYNAEAVNDRLKQLSIREGELSKTLAENNATINYTAKDRGEIGPSEESKAINDRIRAEKEKFEVEKKTANAERRKVLDAEMERNYADAKAQINKANRYDMAMKAAEGVQFGADIAVEGLSYVTGPAGQKIKLAYTASKEVATGMGEGMADPDNAAKHLAKGILKAGSEVLKDKFGSGKPLQATATGILNEGLQSALDASINGANPDEIADALGKGLTKGVFEAGTDKALDVLKDKLPKSIKVYMPKGSEVDVGDFDVSRVYNNNPLTKGILKTAIREVGGNGVKDAIKGKIVDAAGKQGGFGDE